MLNTYFLELMNKSFPVGIWWRIQIQIHWSLPFVFFLDVLNGFNQNLNSENFIFFIFIPWFFHFISVVTHEYGHLVAARYYKLKENYMILTPIGGAVLIDQPKSAWSNFVVAVCGPLTNIIWVALSISILHLLNYQFHYEILNPRAFNQIRYFIWKTQPQYISCILEFIHLQTIIVLFNLFFVAYPLDGGRILHSVLWSQTGYERSLIRSCIIAQYLFITIGIVALIYNNYFLLFIAILGWIQAKADSANVSLSRFSFINSDSKFYEALNKQKASQSNIQKSNSLINVITQFFSGQTNFSKKELHKKVREKGLHALTKEEREFLQTFKQKT